MARGRKDERRSGQPASTTPVTSGDAAGRESTRPAKTPPTDGAAALHALRVSIEETRRDLNARLDTLAAAVDRLLPATAPASTQQMAPTGRRPRPDLRPGDDVYVPRLGGTHTVVEAPAAGETLKVQAGPMRVELRYDEVWTLDDAPSAVSPQARSMASPTRPNPNPAIPSIDLHGYSEANALITLELFLHHEYARRTHRVRVIHGKGNGILRDAVRRELARSPLIRAIDTGPQFHGDDGVTLADLDL